MLGNKEFESSDSDDSDFVIDSHQDSSDDSLQSECESDTTDNTHENHHKKRKKNTNNKKKQVTKNKKKKSLPDEDTTNDEDINSSKNILSPNEEKARADSLWETFLSDTATSSKSRLPNTATNLSANTTDSSDLNKDTSEKQSNDLHTKNLNKVDNKKFTDAKEVIKNNRNLLNKTKDKSATSSQLFVPENDLKKNNISSILQNMQKKQKLTTLEKSKLDWKQFKEEHNLQEEISRHNRGKSGYLEKQDFLQRADLRQFEIEKELRNVGKRKTR